MWLNAQTGWRCLDFRLMYVCLQKLTALGSYWKFNQPNLHGKNQFWQKIKTPVKPWRWNWLEAITWAAMFWCRLLGFLFSCLRLVTSIFGADTDLEHGQCWSDACPGLFSLLHYALSDLDMYWTLDHGPLPWSHPLGIWNPLKQHIFKVLNPEEPLLF